MLLRPPVTARPWPPTEARYMGIQFCRMKKPYLQQKQGSAGVSKTCSRTRVRNQNMQQD
jgi:hypothetical protein